MNEPAPTHAASLPPAAARTRISVVAFSDVASIIDMDPRGGGGGGREKAI